MKKKAKSKYNPNSVIRGVLRRAFARSPIVQEIINESRREVPKYKKDGTLAKKPSVQRQCQTCNQWVGSTKIAVDHVEPVISVEEGFQDWNIFIDRLWCGKDNLARICSTCHYFKTQSERISRLIIQYTLELDELEANTSLTPKELKKLLSKYILKKNTIGLESIVQRAIYLKSNIK
jgi:hypothetical protein